MSIIFTKAEDLIKYSFGEFKKYVNVYDVEFESIKLFEDNNLESNEDYQVIAKVVPQFGVPYLHYSPNILTYNRKHTIAILFHEFIHAIHILKPLYAESVEDLNALMKTKSEFIASSVEMSYMLGSKTYDLCVDESISESVFYILDGIKINTRKYIFANIEAVHSVVLADSSAFVDYNVEKYTKKYNHFHNSAMYYFGKKTAYESILGKHFDCNEEEYFLQFNNILQRLGYLVQTPYNEEIIKVDNELYKEFKKYFPNDNLGE